MRRMTGVVVALCAASMPSAAMAAVLTTFFERWTSHPLTAPALKAAMAAAIAIMVGTAWTMVQSSMNHRRVRTALFAGGAFTLALVSGVTPFQVLIAAAVLGSAWSERDR
jgi:chromate transport protein ChrA